MVLKHGSADCEDLACAIQLHSKNHSRISLILYKATVCLLSTSRTFMSVLHLSSFLFVLLTVAEW